MKTPEVHQKHDPESAAVTFTCPKCGSFNARGVTLKTWDSSTKCLNCGMEIQLPDERNFSA